MDYYGRSRDRLFGLLVGCPFDQCTGDCPLREYRSMELHDRMEIAFTKMTEKEVYSVLTYHDSCSAIRSICPNHEDRKVVTAVHR